MAGALFEFDQRLNDMRIQQLNFGPEFCLCIPDADDVKAAFGHMASIIFKQQTELNSVHASMKKMTDEFVRSQSELVNWTKRNLQDLKDENRDLKGKLEECKNKIDIFSYNLQGFDETIEEAEKEVKGLAATVEHSNIELPPALREGLFGSHDAYDDDDRSPAKHTEKGTQNSEGTAHDEPKQVEGNASTPSPMALPPVDPEVLKKKQALEKEALKSLNTPRAPSRRPSTLDAIAEVSEAPLEATESDTEQARMISERARQRWKLAIKAIKLGYRFKKTSLTKVRLPKSQTLFQRIEKLEHFLFAVEKSMTEKVHAVQEAVATKVIESIPGIVEPLLLRVDEKVVVDEENFQQIDPKIIEELEQRNGKLQNEITDVHERLDSLYLELNRLSSIVRTQENQLAGVKNSGHVPPDIEAKINALIGKLEYSVQIRNMTFQTIVQDLIMKMQSAESDLEKAEVKVTSLTKAALSKDELKSIVEVLKNDTDLREARGKLSVIESTLLSLNYIAKTVCHDLTAARGMEGITEDDIDTFEGMLEDCGRVTNRIESANGRLKVQYDLCRLHDRAVADRWSHLTTSSDAHGHLLEAFSTAMRAFSSELNERPTIDNVKKLIDEAMDGAKKGLQESMTSTMDQLLFKMKIKLVEQETINEMNKQAHKDSPEQNEEAAAKFEGMLEPLISDIVEFYVHRATTPAHDHDEGQHTDQAKNRHSSRLDDSDGQKPGGSRLLARQQQELMLRTLNEELAVHAKKIDEILQKKNDTTEVQNLLASKADIFELANKADARVLETVEKTLRKVIEDLGDLRNLKDAELDKVKAVLEKHVKVKLVTLLSKMEDNAKPAFLATKSLCLSCARVSSVKMSAEPSAPMGFLPALGAASTPGPEVYRAGFKMPVSSRDGLFSRSQIQAVDEVMAMDMDMDELQVAPIKSAGALSLPPPSSSKQARRTAKIITHGGGREDTQLVQPMHRQGLKGKKSDRAAFMAANRSESMMSIDSVGSPASTVETESLMLGSAHSKTLPSSHGQKSKFLAPVRTTTAS